MNGSGGNVSISGDHVKMEAYMLSFSEMTVVQSGSIMTKEAKIELRQKFGYCTSCPEIPVLLYDIKKSKLNPLWTQKQPRKIAGDCEGGVCLKCKTARAQQQYAKVGKPGYSRRHLTPTASGDLSQLSLGSRVSSWKSTDSSQILCDTDVMARPEVASRGSSTVGRSRHRQPPTRTRSDDVMAPLSSTHVASDSRQNVRRRNTEGLASVSNHGRTMRQIPVLRAIPPPRTNSDSSGCLLHDALASSSFHDDDVVSVESSTHSSHSHERRRSREATSSIVPSSASVDVASLSARCENRNFSPIEFLEENELANLQGLVASLCAPETQDVLADVLVHAIKTHEIGDDIHAYCFRITFDYLTQYKLDVNFYTAAGGHKLILAALKSPKTSRQQLADACSIAAAMVASPSSRDRFLQIGGCDQLIKVSSLHIGDDTVTAAVLAAVRVLSLERLARGTLTRLQAAARVVEIMQCHISHVAIQRDGCAILSNLAVDLDRQDVSDVGDSAVQAVVMALKKLGTNKQVAAGACFALKNFTFNQANLKRMSEMKDLGECLLRAQGCCPDAKAVLDIIGPASDGNAELEEQAYESLFALVECNPEGLETLSQVIDMFKLYDWSCKVTAASIEFMRALSTKSIMHKRLVAEHVSLDDLLSRASKLLDDIVLEEVHLLAESITDEEVEPPAAFGATSSIIGNTT